MKRLLGSVALAQICRQQVKSANAANTILCISSQRDQQQRSTSTFTYLRNIHSHAITPPTHISRQIPAARPQATGPTKPQSTTATNITTSIIRSTSSSSSPPHNRQPTQTMASDEDYAAFLDKASKDASGSASATGTSSAKKSGFTTSSVDQEVPTALSSTDRSYTSESDEPFEPVSLGFDGGVDTVRVEDVQKITGRDKVVSLSPKEWDPQGEYDDIVDVVKKAGSGKVGVFRVELGGARSEYWVLSVDKGGKKIVGLRAGSVES